MIRWDGFTLTSFVPKPTALFAKEGAIQMVSYQFHLSACQNFLAILLLLFCQHGNVTELTVIVGNIQLLSFLLTLLFIFTQRHKLLFF